MNSLIQLHRLILPGLQDLLRLFQFLEQCQSQGDWRILCNEGHVRDHQERFREEVMVFG